MKKIKIFFILLILFAIYFFVCAFSYVSAISDNLYNNVLRLHVIANSDSKEDQDLKYTVRDKIIKYLNENTSTISNKEELINFIHENKDTIKTIASETIYNNGFSYPVDVELGNFEFPTKQYGDISFPAGFYDAIRIKIGSSSGQNWWCVLFPPLCFVNTSTGIVPEESKKTLHENLSDENYKIVSESSTPSFSFKFKIIELFEKSSFATAKNNF